MAAGLSCFCLVFLPVCIAGTRPIEAGSRRTTSRSITGKVVDVEQEEIRRYGVQWFHRQPDTTACLLRPDADAPMKTNPTW